jgi:hypothetical protein
VRMGPIRCPETSVNNYHTTPCNNPEDHRFLYTSCRRIAPFPAFLFVRVERFGSRWTCSHENVFSGILLRSVENIHFLFNWKKLTGTVD